MRTLARTGAGTTGHAHPVLAAWLAATLALALAGTGPATAGQAEVIDSGNFRIRPPPGDEWEVTTEPDRVFLRRDRRSRDQLVETTAILVLRTRPVDERCGRSEAQTADDYCRDEAFDLWLSGQVTGLFGLKGLRREEVTVAGKRLYAMHYSQAFAEEFGGARTENAMYLYFPESFHRDDFFYVFLQTEACRRERCPDTAGAMDLTAVKWVIASLEPHDVAAHDR